LGFTAAGEIMRSSILIFLLCAAAAPLGAQPAKKALTPPYPPDLANVAYGPHQRNVIDLWKTPSDKPTPLVIYIHGGGFVGGDKSTVGKGLIDECRKHGISVAAINYRYSTQAIFPAPMLDGARAVQFLRLHAREYHLDPKAFACTGGSAGAGISLWIGFHDDMADPNSTDPVARQSTRLSSIGVTNAQTTYDPRVIAKLIGDETAHVSALHTLFGLKPGEDVLTAQPYFHLYEEASPVNYLTAGDPPVFLFYTRSNVPLPPPDTGTGIHHPRFGYFLKEKMDKLGIECIVKTKDDYAGNPAVESTRDMVEFFVRHFPRPR
jgi:acetyl esterase